MSSSQGSINQTSRFIGPLLKFLFPDASTETLLFYHGIIRKLAHLSEYAVLGLLACRAFVLSPLRSHPFVFAAVTVFVVAAIDETNQSFNPLRTGSPVDVLIDVVGGLAAIMFSYWLMMRKKR
jgi:VanZ family protein